MKGHLREFPVEFEGALIEEDLKRDLKDISSIWNRRGNLKEIEGKPIWNLTEIEEKAEGSPLGI